MLSPRSSTSDVGLELIGVCCTVLLIFMATALNIVEIVYGAKYLHDTGCNNTELIKPAVWLIVDGSIGIFASVVTIILGIVAWKTVDDGYVEVLSFCCKALFIVFQVFWLVFGSVSVWKFNPDCSPSNLKDLLWATLIIQIVFISMKVLPSLFK